MVCPLVLVLRFVSVIVLTANCSVMETRNSLKCYNNCLHELRSLFALHSAAVFALQTVYTCKYNVSLFQIVPRLVCTKLYQPFDASTVELQRTTGNVQNTLPFPNILLLL